MMRLDARQRRWVADALLQAFSREGLEALVANALGVQLHEIAGARDSSGVALQVVLYAERKGGIEALIRGALDAHPSNLALRTIAESFGLAPPTDALMELVRPFAPPDEWRRLMYEVMEQVAIVRLDDGVYLSGFLVGPDQIMTCSDVLVSRGRGHTLKQQLTSVAQDIAISFQSPATNEAVWYRLSRREPVVLASDNTGIAVLRLEEAAGRALALGRSRARGFLLLDRIGAAPAVHSPVAVIGFRQNFERVVSFDPEGFLGTSDDGVELRYRTATAPGSSGSPIFDVHWSLIGVHRAADEQFNSGVPLHRVHGALHASGFEWSPSGGYVRRSDATAPDSSADDMNEALRAFQWTRKDDDADAWTAEDIDKIAPAAERWAWVEAAAVYATFEPNLLTPLGAATSTARTALLLESRPVRGRNERWMLGDALRQRALKRLAGRGALQSARAANAAMRDETDVHDRYLESLIQGEGKTKDLPTDPNELRAALRVATWLDGATAPGTLAAIRSALERATLLAPFRHLTQRFFAGRDDELAQLRAYVESSGTAKRPPYIYGHGGMGKSAMLAHFIERHAGVSDSQPGRWQPFVYIDFDQPAIDASNVDTIFRAVIRQLVQQGGQEFDKSANALLAQWDSERPEAPVRRATKAAQRVTPRSRGKDARHQRDVADLLETFCEAAEAPLLLVLDTVEEALYATPDAVVPLIQKVVALAKEVPALRPVFAGRIRPDRSDNLVQMLELKPLPSDVAEPVLANLLPDGLRQNQALIGKAVRIYGGTPLTLTLLAEALEREGDAANSDVLAEDDALWRRLGDVIVQGRLYERILGHVHSSEVQAIANPGLAVRRITPQIIKEVLAAPCGITVADDAAAQTLFDELAQESALVRQGDDPTVLELRPELRRALLEDFAHDGEHAARRQAIHAAAVAFYSKADDPRSRAEEVYHRLMLDEDPEGVDRRWIEAIGPSLRSTLEELPPRARAYVANRLGLVDDAALSPTASPIEWEGWCEKRATTLIQLGEPERALQLLRSRTERLPTSRLYLLESIALRTSRDRDLESAQGAARRAVAAAKSSGDSGERRAALEELVQVSRMVNDDEGVMRALAELGNLGEALGDDLVVLQSAVERLESFGPDVEESRFSDQALAVFARLPDELVAGAPELARRVAAQVGQRDPDTLKRVLRLVGTGRIGTDVADGLREVLSDWASKEPDIASFVPRPSAPVAELSKAFEYLTVQRSITPAVSGSIADWMKTFVVPKLGNDDDPADDD